MLPKPGVMFAAFLSQTVFSCSSAGSQTLRDRACVFVRAHVCADSKPGFFEVPCPVGPCGVCAEGKAEFNICYTRFPCESASNEAESRVEFLPSLKSMGILPLTLMDPGFHP